MIMNLLDKQFHEIEALILRGTADAENINRFIEVITEIFLQKFDSEKDKEEFSIFNFILSEIITALENKDNVQLYDLIRYTLKDFVSFYINQSRGT